MGAKIEPAEITPELPPGVRDGFVNTPAVRIHYVEGANTGAPFVFLHGVGRDWRDCWPLIKAFQNRWHVFALDFRGHGKSGRAANGYRSGAYAEDVVEFLRAVVGGPAVLFGHSLGGVAAMHVAAREPELVRAAILGDNVLSRDTLAKSMYQSLFTGLLEIVPGGGTAEQMARQLADLRIPVPFLDHPVRIGDLPGNDDAYLLAWAACLEQLDPTALQMTVSGTCFEDFDADDLLQKIKCPTLILQASPELGGLMKDEEVQRALRLLKYPNLMRFPLLGHALHLQQAQPVIDAVTEFVERL
ncbi:MAG TPA: alpha/beta hydrolase [Terriglobales bacterium]|nr:alpha/beta hydrolase [Terriglobales bacterium]